MKKYKIMLLGGNYYQMTATKAAKELGCHVISVDYLPDNPAHKYADEYHNVSTIDREAVLNLAKKLKIDGIATYASDVSAPTVAYVAEKLGLPTNPYESVNVLTHKNLMRKFLKKHDFNVPKSQDFDNFLDAYEYFKTLDKPIMVKPVDSSGSKGVSRVLSDDEFKAAYNEAMKYSISKNIIVEEFIERKGHQIAGDGFLVNGKLKFAGLMNEHFDDDCNALVPIGESYPSSTMISSALRQAAINEIQRFMTLLNMKMGAINLDFIIGADDKIYIIEIGPRNGGNLITDVIKYASGVDLAKYTILSALGLDCSDLCEKPINNFVSSYIVHALEDGIFNEIRISDEIKDDIILSKMFIKTGDEVCKFNNAGFGLGAMLIKFDSIDEMNYRMDHMNEFIEVVTKGNSNILGGGVYDLIIPCARYPIYSFAA